MNTQPMFYPIPDYGDKMTIAEFKEAVEDGSFIDYDGHGYLAKEDQESDVLVKPSTFKSMILPEWATHVMWYNR